MQAWAGRLLRRSVTRLLVRMQKSLRGAACEEGQRKALTSEMLWWVEEGRAFLAGAPAGQVAAWAPHVQGL